MLRAQLECEASPQYFIIPFIKNIKSGGVGGKLY